MRGSIFNLPKLLKQNITIDGNKVNSYFLSLDKSHCFYKAPNGKIWEFEETYQKECPFVFTRLI